MTRVQGKDLRAGMPFPQRTDGSFAAVIVRITRRTIPAAVLTPYYAERYPDGMPGGTAHTEPPMYSQTFFDDEWYEVAP